MMESRAKRGWLLGATLLLGLLTPVRSQVRGLEAPLSNLRPRLIESRIRTVADRIALATVRIETEDGMGSGTILDDEGHILTSAHVIERNHRIRVTLTDGRAYLARVLGINGAGDIGLLRIDGTDFTPARLGDSDDVRPGQWVIAAGHPASPFDDFQPTISGGVVREVDAVIRADENKLFNDAIVSDAPLSPGSSGGGLYDLEGRLIGLNAAVTRNERSSFSVRISEYLADARRLRLGEHFDRRALKKRRSAAALAESRSRESYFASMFRDVQRLVDSREVIIRHGRSFSGLVVSPAGHVLTVSELLRDVPAGAFVDVRTAASSHERARVVAHDLTNGVSLLRLPPSPRGYASYRLHRPRDVRRGDFALSTNIHGVVTGGIVSAAHRTPPLTMTDSVYYPDVVQVDIRLQRPNLGAAVVDREGWLTGMVVQHRLQHSSDTFTRDPYGAFLLPVSALAESFSLLRSGRGRGERPVGFLGVRLEDLTERQKASYEVDSGVLVAWADRRLPAHAAGIRGRDVILSIGGHPVISRGSAITRIASYRRGDEVPVVVRRGGTEHTYTVKMADRSDF